MSQNKFTTNANPTLVAVSNADDETPVYLWADPTTRRLLVDASGTIAAGTDLVESPNVGQTTSNATAQQLNGGSSIAATNGILVQAIAANTNNVYIGGSGVTSSNGYELQPGQAVPFTVNNIADLYVIGGSGSDKVCWNVL